MARDLTEPYSTAKGGSGRSDALALYEGGAHRVDRVNRGAVYVKNWSGCVLGAIQIEKLRALVPDLSSDGLLQRFMPIVPAQMIPTDDDDDKAPDRAAIDAYNGRCAAFAPYARRSAPAAATSR